MLWLFRWAMPAPLEDDFDAIFGEPDEAVKSRLDISPPKLKRTKSNVKLESDEVDYEVIELEEKRLNTPLRNTLESVSITPAKANEMLQNILSKRPPKLASLDHLPPPAPTSRSTSTTTKTESPGRTDKAIEETNNPVEKMVEKKVSETKRKSEEKSPQKKQKVESTAKTNQDHPQSYAKQNFDKLYAQAVEKKRAADGLRDGKELPCYLKAIGLYAQAYSNYQIFSQDSVDKWRGLLEFTLQIEKKCVSYKNDITVGICNALMAWTHHRIISLYLQDAQTTVLPAIDIIGKSTGEAETIQAQKMAPALSLGITQIILHHERVKQCWLRAVSLVPTLSKYGFCVYSSVEDLVKTIDRYI